MIAVDTNILLRLVIRDDLHQFAVAEALLESEIFVSLTVTMETEWVLRSKYRYSRAQIYTLMSNLLAVRSVVVERRTLIEWVVRRYADTGDFADLIHLAGLPEGIAAFATFDKALARAAGSESPVPVQTLS